MTDRFAVMGAHLIAAAKAIAAAHIEERRLQRSDPAARWRKASLLWPGFGNNFSKG